MEHLSNHDSPEIVDKISLSGVFVQTSDIFKLFHTILPKYVSLQYINLSNTSIFDNDLEKLSTILNKICKNLGDNFNIYVNINSKYLKFNKEIYQEPIIIEIRKSNIDLLLNKYNQLLCKKKHKCYVMFVMIEGTLDNPFICIY